MIKYSKVILFNSDLDTTQAFVFSEANHYLGLLISGSGDDVFTKIRQAALDMEEKFFSLEEDIPERFDIVYKSLSAQLNDLENLEVLFASWRVGESSQPQVKGTTDILYLQSFGEARVYLKRKEEIIPLITQSSNRQLISGYLEQGDRILLLSKTLDRILASDSGRLGYTLSVPVTDLEEEIQSFIPEQGVMDPLAAILIDYRLEEEQSNVERIEPVNLTHRPPIPDYSTTPVPHQARRRIPQIRLAPLLSQIKSRLPNFRKNSVRYNFHEPETPQYLSSSINSKSFISRVIFRLWSNKKRFVLLLAGLVVVLVLLSLMFRSHRSAQVKTAEFKSLMTSAQNDFATADNLKNLNTTSAKQSLDKAESEIAQALQINPKDSSAQSLKTQIDNGKNDILKIYPITNWPQFLDLKLIKSNFSAEKMSYSGGEFLLLDPIQKTLVSVDADQKTNQILGGSIQLGDAESVALSDNFAIAYSTDKGVLLTDIQNPKPQVVIKPDTAWGKISDVAGFAGGVYLLDTQKNQIWKYVAVASGYSDRAAYLQSGVKADFSDAKEMLIDASIWVLKQSNEIDKFTSGAVDFFSPSGLDIPLKSVASFYVSPDTDNVYILDSGNGRLVVTKKNGEYESQYTGDKFRDATDVAVDEKAKKIYLLENNSIYQIDLR